jgi:stearoyl-CoA desaturase (delta-9 desaturase)
MVIRKGVRILQVTWLSLANNSFQVMKQRRRQSSLTSTSPKKTEVYHNYCEVVGLNSEDFLKSNTLYRAVVLAVVVVPLIATVYAVYRLWNFAISWSDVALLVSMYILTALGVTIGFHRMLTHRSFNPHPIVKFILLVLGSMALEGAAIEWTATHIKHHAQADREGDPHSPVEGFFHSHIGWLFKDRQADPKAYCRHLEQDRIVMFVSRTFFIWVALSLLIPFALGGWTGLLWGGLVRIFLAHHVTWSVNSVCHTFGKREFETNDQSRNEWVIGLLALGEGWHNNHHAFPRSAFHGLHWWQFDASGYVIWMLERFGLAKNVYRVSPAMIARRAGKHEGEANVTTSLPILEPIKEPV